MSYPQFNLTTLQLPAPASNMTKAEYKAAYGIDLDQVNIKAFKLVLLGNEKYPIDQIKAVEDGYEIYFNGRILSITNIVQTSDEVYDVANAKPIYMHPIVLNDSTLKISATINIFNNSNEPLDTWAKVKSFMFATAESIGGIARFPINGAYIDVANSKVYNCSVLDATSNTIKLFGYDTEGVFLNGLDITSKTITSVFDGVNKIN